MDIERQFSFLRARLSTELCREKIEQSFPRVYRYPPPLAPATLERFVYLVSLLMLL